MTGGVLMDVLDLLYKERDWTKRIYEAGEWKNYRIRKCDRGLYGLLGFLVGFLACYVSILTMIYVSI